MQTKEDVYQFVTPGFVGTHPTMYLWPGGNYVWPKPVRAMRANAAGDITYKDYGGVTCVAKFTAGETRQLGATEIVSAGTTVVGIEGMP